MTERQKIRMTAAQYHALPETPHKTELINGEYIEYKGKKGVSPAAKDLHEEIVSLIFAILLKFVPARELRVSKTDVYLADEVVVQPDVLWFDAKRERCVRGDDGYLHGPPDLVVEVLSKSTAQRDREEKYDIYEQHGVREYWIVDPSNRTLEVYTLADAAYTRQGVYAPADTFESPVLGGKVTMRDIFDE